MNIIRSWKNKQARVEAERRSYKREWDETHAGRVVWKGYMDDEETDCLVGVGRCTRCNYLIEWTRRRGHVKVCDRKFSIKNAVPRPRRKKAPHPPTETASPSPGPHHTPQSNQISCASSAPHQAAAEGVSLRLETRSERKLPAQLHEH